MSDPSSIASPPPTPTGGNPYAPQIPPELFLLEKYDFAGVQLSNIFYGVTVVLYIQCMFALLQSRPKPRYPLAIYATVLFALGTIFTAINARITQLAFVENREFPGGPEAWTLTNYANAMPLTANSAFIIANWLADALLLYRCKVVWYQTYWILGFPLLIALGDFVMGTLYLYQLSHPGSHLFTQEAIDFGLPYFVLSTSLNIILTLLLCSRLLYHQRAISSAGLKTNSYVQNGNGLPYMSIVSILVESSAIYAVSSIVFIGTYGAGHISAALFLPLLAQAQIISPLMIIFRVARRKAWTSQNTMSLTFPASSGSYEMNPGHSPGGGHGRSPHKLVMTGSRSPGASTRQFEEVKKETVTTVHHI